MLQRHVPGRSALFTPASNPDRFAKAAASGADAIILDLEDAVAPDAKSRAREAALRHLAGSMSEGPLLWGLRINALGTRDGLADLAALLDGTADPDFVVLPKVEAGAEVRIVDTLLRAAGKRTRLVALVESARALTALGEIVTASPRLAGLMFGAADMAADLGAANAWAPLAHARACLVAAASPAGLACIDTPFFDIHDADGLARETADAVAFGFTAKAAIHPGQIATINAALTPDARAVAEARAILEANTKGVGVVDGRMVDEAVARKARRVLAAAGEGRQSNQGD